MRGSIAGTLSAPNTAALIIGFISSLIFCLSPSTVWPKRHFLLVNFFLSFEASFKYHLSHKVFPDPFHRNNNIPLFAAETLCTSPSWLLSEPSAYPLYRSPFYLHRLQGGARFYHCCKPDTQLPNQVVPWYTRRTGSRIPVDTKIHGCSSPLVPDSIPG